MIKKTITYPAPLAATLDSLTAAHKLLCIALMTGALLLAVPSLASPLCTTTLNSHAKVTDEHERDQRAVLEELSVLRQQIAQAHAEHAVSLALMLARDYSRKLAHAAEIGISTDQLKRFNSANKASSTHKLQQENDRTRAVEESEQIFAKWTKSRLPHPALESTYSIIQSPRGSQVIVKQEDGTLQLADDSRFNLISRLPSKIDLLHTPVFSGDGTKIAYLGENGRMEIYNALTGKQFRSLAVGDLDIDSIDLNFDGDLLLIRATIADLYVFRLLNIHTGQKVMDFKDPSDLITGARISPDGRRVLTESNRTVARLWDAASGKQLSLLQTVKPMSRCEFSRDGGSIFTFGRSGDITIFSADTGAELQRLSGHTDHVYSIDINHDRTQALTAGGDGKIILWNLQTGSILRTFSNGVSQVVSARFMSNRLPGSSMIVSFSADNSVKMWNENSGELIRQLKGKSPQSYRHKDRVIEATMTIAPDADTIVVHLPPLPPTVWRRENSSGVAP